LFAASWGNKDDDIKLVKYLLQNGADINHINNDGETALFSSVGWVPSIEMIKCLVETGCNINHKNNDGKNILEYAKESDTCSKEIIEYLTDCLEGK
jgi:ankyrin repeat protein